MIDPSRIRDIASQKIVTLSLGLVFLVAGMLVAAPNVVGATAPDWDVGDTWQYRGETRTQISYDGSIPGLGSVPDTRSTDVDHHWLRVVADDETVNGHPVYTVARSHDGEVFVDAFHVSQEDLSLVVELDEDDCDDEELNGTQACAQGWGRRYMLDFPLKEGKSWQVMGPEWGQVDDTVATVQARETLETELGEIDAFRITLEDPDEPEDTGEYTYWYAPDTGWIVRESFGVTFAGGVSGSISGTEDLVATSTAEDLPDRPDDVETRVELSTRRLQADQRESVTLTAQADGAPEETTFVWEIGPDRLEGQEVAYTPRFPGLYRVELTAAGPAGTVGHEVTSVAADLTHTMEGTYDTFGEEAEEELFIGDGPAIVELDYTQDSPSPVHDTDDDVSLTDDDGDEVPIGQPVWIHPRGSPEAGDWTLGVETSSQEAATGDYQVTLDITYQFPEDDGDEEDADASASVPGLATQAERLAAMLR